MPDIPIIAPIQTDDFKVKLLEEKILALKELMIIIRRGDQRALKLQAAEYERRLSSLNHEAEQLKAMQEKYVPREVFDRVVLELQRNSQINSDYRIKQEGQGLGKDAFSKYIPWLLSLIATITIAVLMYYKSK